MPVGDRRSVGVRWDPGEEKGSGHLRWFTGASPREDRVGAAVEVERDENDPHLSLHTPRRAKTGVEGKDAQDGRREVATGFTGRRGSLEEKVPEKAQGA